MRVKLEVLGGPLDGHLFQFNKTVQIGREGDVALGVDRFVSRRHASVCVGAEGATIEDLGSHNGTHVAGRRIEGRVALRDGDEIRLGSITLVYRAFAAGETESEPG